MILSVPLFTRKYVVLCHCLLENISGFLQLHGKTIQGLFQDFPGVQIQFSRAASVLFVY